MDAARRNLLLSALMPFPITAAAGTIGSKIDDEHHAEIVELCELEDPEQTLRALNMFSAFISGVTSLASSSVNIIYNMAQFLEASRVGRMYGDEEAHKVSRRLFTKLATSMAVGTGFGYGAGQMINDVKRGQIKLHANGDKSAEAKQKLAKHSSHERNLLRAGLNAAATTAVYVSAEGALNLVGELNELHQAETFEQVPIYV